MMATTGWDESIASIEVCRSIFPKPSELRALRTDRALKAIKKNTKIKPVHLLKWGRPVLKEVQVKSLLEEWQDVVAKYGSSLDDYDYVVSDNFYIKKKKSTSKYQVSCRYSQYADYDKILKLSRSWKCACDVREAFQVPEMIRLQEVPDINVIKDDDDLANCILNQGVVSHMVKFQAPDVTQWDIGKHHEPTFTCSTTFASTRNLLTLDSKKCSNVKLTNAETPTYICPIHQLSSPAVCSKCVDFTAYTDPFCIVNGDFGFVFPPPSILTPSQRGVLVGIINDLNEEERNDPKLHERYKSLMSRVCTIGVLDKMKKGTRSLAKVKILGGRALGHRGTLTLSTQQIMDLIVMSPATDNQIESFSPLKIMNRDPSIRTTCVYSGIVLGHDKSDDMTISLCANVAEGMGADCDGDEITLYVPTAPHDAPSAMTMAAALEMKNLTERYGPKRNAINEARYKFTKHERLTAGLYDSILITLDVTWRMIKETFPDATVEKRLHMMENVSCVYVTEGENFKAILTNLQRQNIPPMEMNELAIAPDDVRELPHSQFGIMIDSGTQGSKRLVEYNYNLIMKKQVVSEEDLIGVFDRPVKQGREMGQLGRETFVGIASSVDIKLAGDTIYSAEEPIWLNVRENVLFGPIFYHSDVVNTTLTAVGCYYSEVDMHTQCKHVHILSCDARDLLLKCNDLTGRRFRRHLIIFFMQAHTQVVTRTWCRIVHGSTAPRGASAKAGELLKRVLCGVNQVANGDVHSLGLLLGAKMRGDDVQRALKVKNMRFTTASGQADGHGDTPTVFGFPSSERLEPNMGTVNMTIPYLTKCHGGYCAWHRIALVDGFDRDRVTQDLKQMNDKMKTKITAIHALDDHVYEIQFFLQMKTHSPAKSLKKDLMAWVWALTECEWVHTFVFTSACRIFFELGEIELGVSNFIKFQFCSKMKRHQMFLLPNEQHLFLPMADIIMTCGLLARFKERRKVHHDHLSKVSGEDPHTHLHRGTMADMHPVAPGEEVYPPGESFTFDDRVFQTTRVQVKSERGRRMLGQGLATGSGGFMTSVVAYERVDDGTDGGSVLPVV